jgi:hypothetical protein
LVDLKKGSIFKHSFLVKFFYADPDPGSGIFLTLDPGFGKENFDPG